MEANPGPVGQVGDPLGQEPVGQGLQFCPSFLDQASAQGDQNVGRIAAYNLLPTTTSAYETTITSPIEGRVEEAGVPFTVEGTARATSGVSRVQVEIRDRNSNRYLQDDLVTWGGGNTINATLASPNAATTNWSLPLTIQGNQNLQVYARAFAVNGNSDQSKDVNKFETFSTTDRTPTASISGPSGVVPSTTFTVTGTASDDGGVQVQIDAGPRSGADETGDLARVSVGLRVVRGLLASSLPPPQAVSAKTASVTSSANPRACRTILLGYICCSSSAPFPGYCNERHFLR